MKICRKNLSELNLNGATLTVLTSVKRGIVKKAEVRAPQPVEKPVYMDMDDVPDNTEPQPIISPSLPPPVVKPETRDDKINKLPTHKFKPQTEIEASPPACQICQCEFTEDEEVKTLKCNHEYHTMCVDPWLKENDTCPLCNLKAF